MGADGYDFSGHVSSQAAARGPGGGRVYSRQVALPELAARDTIPAERGFHPTGSCLLSKIETLNTKNENVLLKTPPASLSFIVIR